MSLFTPLETAGHPKTFKIFGLSFHHKTTEKRKIPGASIYSNSKLNECSLSPIYSFKTSLVLLPATPVTVLFVSFKYILTVFKMLSGR